MGRSQIRFTAKNDCLDLLLKEAEEIVAGQEKELHREIVQALVDSEKIKDVKNEINGLYADYEEWVISYSYEMYENVYVENVQNVIYVLCEELGSEVAEKITRGVSSNVKGVKAERQLKKKELKWKEQEKRVNEKIEKMIFETKARKIVKGMIATIRRGRGMCKMRRQITERAEKIIEVGTRTIEAAMGIKTQVIYDSILKVVKKNA